MLQEIGAGKEVVIVNVCLGTVQFGIDYGIQGGKRKSREEIFRILDYAIQHGIRQLDTAPGYGDAEKILGEYFIIHPEFRSKISIVSKLNKCENQICDVKTWGDEIVAQANESLDRIGIDSFDTFLFHDPSLIFNPNAVEALCEVKRRGYTKRIGVSVYTPEEALKALEYDDITAIQIPYNVLDHRLDKCGFFEKVMERCIVVYARSTLLQGLLLMNPDGLPERVSFTKKYIRLYNDICFKNDLSPLETAIGYVLSKKGIDYIVFGVDSLAQMKEYIACLNTPISSRLISEIEESFSEIEEKVINPSMW